MRISLIGSGNVATHLGAALRNAGYTIRNVWSRTPRHAALLAYHLKARATDALEDALQETDLLILSVSDDAIPGIAAKVRVGFPVVHTSGSTDIAVLAGSSPLTGVLYPLQTFSKAREVNFRDVPVAVEGSNADVARMLREIASNLSNNVTETTSEQRLALHVAAVFAGNFSNHLYRVAEAILTKNGLGFDMIRPLIAETAAKVNTLSPGDAQTGPAVRNDAGILHKHLQFLGNEPELAAMYELLSQQIINFRT